MAKAGKRPDVAKANSQLFPHLAPQTCLPGLTGFALAAWKLPIAGEVRAWLPLANQVLASSFNEREGDVEPLDAWHHRMGSYGTCAARHRWDTEATAPCRPLRRNPSSPG